MPSPAKSKEKAKGIQCFLGELGNPLLAKATAIIECELWREYDGGDHAIIVGAVKNRKSCPSNRSHR